MHIDNHNLCCHKINTHFLFQKIMSRIIEETDYYSEIVECSDVAQPRLQNRIVGDRAYEVTWMLNQHYVVYKKKYKCKYWKKQIFGIWSGNPDMSAGIPRGKILIFLRTQHITQNTWVGCTWTPRETIMNFLFFYFFYKPTNENILIPY